MLAGGTLQIDGALINGGVFDGGNSPAVFSAANSILDLATGSWTNMGSTSVNMGANTLLIVPAGFNTATDFGACHSLGLTHTVGSRDGFWPARGLPAAAPSAIP